LSATVRSVKLRHSQHRRSRHSDVIVQLLPVVGNVGIGGVADDVIVEEDEQETVSLRVDLVDEQPPKLDRAPDRAQEVARQNNDCHLRMRTKSRDCETFRLSQHPIHYITLHTETIFIVAKITKLQGPLLLTTEQDFLV